MKENTILSPFLTLDNLYLPSKSVDTPFAAPCIFTLAPGIGYPVAFSTTDPVTVF